MENPFCFGDDLQRDAGYVHEMELSNQALQCEPPSRNIEKTNPFASTAATGENSSCLDRSPSIVCFVLVRFQFLKEMSVPRSDPMAVHGSLVFVPDSDVLPSR